MGLVGAVVAVVAVATVDWIEVAVRPVGAVEGEIAESGVDRTAEDDFAAD